MTDIDILVLGCIVSFIAVGGAYLYLRERFLDEAEHVESESGRASELRRAV